jgi:UDP-N-acetylglucosamine:LPS N-acetylglucosamine transferase
MKNNFKIAIVAGGTGGHIFPAISLLEQLINEKKEIIFFPIQE